MGKFSSIFNETYFKLKSKPLLFLKNILFYYFFFKSDFSAIEDFQKFLFIYAWIVMKFALNDETKEVL